MHARRFPRAVRWFLSLAVPALALAALSACGGGADDSAARPTLPVAVTTAGAGAKAELDGEGFVVVRTLPAAALSGERLRSAGEATGEDGGRIAMATAEDAGVEPWELVSPADDGWRVWRPQVVLDVLAIAGAGSQLVSVEAVDWPDACIGAAEPGQVCAAVITPGYRIAVELDGQQVTYHASRLGQFKVASQ